MIPTDPSLMGLASFVGVMVANFMFIFLKAFQQRNVAHTHYALIIPTTFALAFVEVYVVSAIATSGFSLAMVAAIGIGGASGCLLSVWTHNRFVTKKEPM